MTSRSEGVFVTRYRDGHSEATTRVFPRKRTGIRKHPGAKVHLVDHVTYYWPNDKRPSQLLIPSALCGRFAHMPSKMWEWVREFDDQEVCLRCIARRCVASWQAFIGGKP